MESFTATFPTDVQPSAWKASDIAEGVMPDVKNTTGALPASVLCSSKDRGISAPLAVIRAPDAKQAEEKIRMEALIRHVLMIREIFMFMGCSFD